MKKHIKFTDRAIANLRHSDYEFTYVAKDGSTKTRKQIEITFQDLRHTRLKGLKIRIFRNGGFHFGLSYSYDGKSKRLPLGEYIPGVFGKKEIEDKLYKITETHLSDKAYWIINEQSCG